MTDKTLFEPYALGSLTLANRVVHAPLTRNRAGNGFVPSEFVATYYSQRAAAGLLIGEATQISQQGQGYQDAPGICSAAQMAGWREVTDAPSFDPATLYGGGAAGYIDYPTLAGTSAQ